MTPSARSSAFLLLLLPLPLPPALLLPAEEEKTEFDVILADVGANKMQVIKTVKELTGAS